MITFTLSLIFSKEYACNYLHTVLVLAVQGVGYSGRMFSVGILCPFNEKMLSINIIK